VIEMLRSLKTASGRGIKIPQPSNHNREVFVCAMTADAAAGKSQRRGLRWAHLPRIVY
jgi:hypothetical protein